MNALLKTIKLLGLFRGLLFFIGIKFKLGAEFYFPYTNSTIIIRPNTSDFMVFEQIFLNFDYSLPFEGDIRTIIDAGANTGFAALFFSKQFPNATIVSIEPEPMNFSVLLKNTSHLQNVVPLQSALWNELTHLSLFDSGNKEWAFQTRKSEEGGSLGLTPTTTIDQILLEQKWDEIDILKIDIEGSEKEVFKNNFTNWLPKTKYLIIELHDHMNAGASESVANALKEYDFKKFRKGENHLFINQRK